MSTKKDETLFETFNAKFLTLEQVGKTFIPHEEFLRLVENKHSIILGARGSGKTTLLKMLTIPALNSWETKKPKYISIKNGLPFVSVYIPADLIWEKEINIIEQKLKKYPNFSSKIINAIFTTNVLISFVKTLKFLVPSQIEGNSNSEIQLVEQIVKEWHLHEMTFLSLSGVIKELQSRVNAISSLISEVEDSNDSEERLPKIPYFNLNYLKCLPPICTTYDILYSSQRETKWALCFDELEIVPIKIVISLFQELRNTPGQFLFKLSTCPIQSLGSENLYGANQMDELNIIKMWPSNVPNSKKIENDFGEDDDIHRSDYQTFCSELALARFNRLFKSKYNITEKISLDQILGKFDYYKIFRNYTSAINGKKFSEELRQNTEGDEFKEGSLGWLAFRELAFLDPNFSHFLSSNKINPTDPYPQNDLQRTQIHRKLKQIVFNRLIFTKKTKKDLNKGKSPFGYKARRKATLYHGVKTLINIVDGNPRYLSGIIDELVDTINLKNLVEGRQIIEIANQSEIIIKIAEKFVNKLKAIPISQKSDTQHSSTYHNKHLLDLVDTIGKVIQNQINIEPLDKEPHGSINIDPLSFKDPQLMELIKIGINWGAFIIVSKDEKERYDHLLGTRIRIAYLLAPYYKLPLRLYQPLSLNQCLNYKSSKWTSQTILKLDNDESL